MYYSRVEYRRVIHTRELAQQDGSKTQDARMMKNVVQDCAFLVLHDIFMSFCRPESYSRPVA